MSEGSNIGFPRNQFAEDIDKLRYTNLMSWLGSVNAPGESYAPKIVEGRTRRVEYEAVRGGE